MQPFDPLSYYPPLYLDPTHTPHPRLHATLLALRKATADPQNPHIQTSLARLIALIDDENFDFGSIAGVGARDLIWGTLRRLRQFDPAGSTHLLAYQAAGEEPRIVQCQTNLAETALAAIATLSNKSKHRRRRTTPGLPHELWNIIAHEYLLLSTTCTKHHPKGSIGHSVCQILFGTQ
jgi:hypothetical protein